MNLYGFFYKTLRRIVAGPLYRMTVTGAENVPAEGPVVLCCNHTAMMDVLALSSSTPRQIRFMAKKELFSVPFVGKLVAACGAFPVDRAGMDVGAVKKAIGILSQGEIMGIFPQGTRCPGVHPGQTYDKLHGGMAMVAVRAKAAIVPVCIETDCHKLKLFYGNIAGIEHRVKHCFNHLVLNKIKCNVVCDISRRNEENNEAKENYNNLFPLFHDLDTPQFTGL